MLGFNEHPQSVDCSLTKLGINPPDDPVYVDDHVNYYRPEGFERIRAFIKEKGIILILIDSFPNRWDMNNQSDDSERVWLLNQVLELAREAHVTVGLVYHESNSIGRSNHPDDGDSRSSILAEAKALEEFGMANQVILMDQRHGLLDNQRVIKTISRYPESPSDLVVALKGNAYLNHPGDYGYSLVSVSLKKRILCEVELGNLEDEASRILERHVQGNIDCNECDSDHYPMRCRCGGLIHGFYDSSASTDCASTYYFTTVCDKCRQYTTEQIWNFDYSLLCY
jgi:hypothetical protein